MLIHNIIYVNIIFGEILVSRDELITYIKQNHLNSAGKLNSKKPIPESLFPLILEETKNFDDTYDITDRVNLIFQSFTEAPICPSCNVNKLKFTKYRKFNQYCSPKCAAIDPARNEKIQSKIDYTKRGETTKKRILEVHGVEQYFNSEEFRQKSKKTHNKKYSTDNISKVEAFKQKKKATFNANYNQKQKEELYEARGKKISANYPNVQYIKDNLEELLNEYTPIQLSRKFNVAFSTVYHYISDNSNIIYNKKSSSYERQLCKFLDDIGITYSKNDRKQISPNELDIFCPEHNLAIEINGIYFHHDGRINKDYHLTKTKKCNDKNIHLIHLWDTQIDEKFDIIKSLISAQMKKTKNVIHGRKCKITNITQTEYKNFCEQNHIQGYCSAKIKLGLVHDDNIVAVMSFGTSRFNKKIQWELVRFCNLVDTHVIGGASKLFKYFVKNYNPETIISYCERSIFTGNLYKKLGFVFSHFSKPNYFYFKRSVLETRNKFQKHKLHKILEIYDENLTEYENMKMNDYKRVWDCGQSVWLWGK